MDFKRYVEPLTGEEILEVPLRGAELLQNPLFNKGVAFSEEERRELGIEGLLPPRVLSLEEDTALAYDGYRLADNNIERYIYLTSLHDRNETLFYRLLLGHIGEMIPIVYTPVVAEAVERFSHIWRKPRGVFIAFPQKDRIEEILQQAPWRDRIEAIVVTDGERVLGIGDQGVGGMAISIGKLTLYTLCGGIRPETTLPVMLDAGTDNAERLRDPLYLGWRHPRVRGAQYDDFLEAFVSAVRRTFPDALLQFEDFATRNARTLLERYRSRLCTFNDDIQGTGAVALATLMAAATAKNEKLAAQNIVIAGAGSAGLGIASQIAAAIVAEGATPTEAAARLWLTDIGGLLTTATPGLTPAQDRFAKPAASVAGWRLTQPGVIGLADVVANVHPTVLIGVTATRGVFTEAIVREMAAHTPHPLIMPLSNPTARAEAVPADIIRWTDGRALIATGSPFPEVEYEGRKIAISQCNNSFIFPGVALGVIASRARHVSDDLFTAAALALAQCTPPHSNAETALLPRLENVREVSRRVAMAVASQAQREGLAEPTAPEEMERRIASKMWTPRYAHILAMK